MTVEAPYGSWSSPITAEQVVAAANNPGEVQLAGDAVFWSESRPGEGGRIQLRRRRADGTIDDLLPEGWSARTRVHEYGGGAWIPTADAVYFSFWDDQRVHRLALGPDGAAGEPVPITPEPAEKHALRYADLQVVGDRVLAVRETHPAGGGPAQVHGGSATIPSSTQVLNELVSIPADGIGEETVLVSGPDFVMAPRADASGSRLAWVEWVHPAMPWDATTLCVATLSPSADAIAGRTVVTGGADQGPSGPLRRRSSMSGEHGGPATLVSSSQVPAESAVQPMWAPDGTLIFASDRTGWWNLYRFDPVGGGVSAVTAGEWELAEPQWVFAMSRAAVLDDGRIVAVAMADGAVHLRLFERGDTTGTPIDTGFSDIASVRATGTTACFVGASFTQEPVVAACDLASREVSDTSRDASVRVLAPSRDLGLSSEWFSVARHLTFPSGAAGARRAHALYYPPTSPTHSAPEGTAPPVIARIHGGPTAAARPRLSLEYQFWTSRGFAIVDVNYGGSIGYGRAFRDSLRDNWGVVDVEDCIAAVEYLAGSGLADRDKLCIQGGSAGGFTVLAALSSSDMFAAGANLFGVADLAVLAEETHKFESRYLDGLIGPYPEAADVYRERSPLTHVDAISSPLIVFQGLDDEVVPPNQSEMIVDAVRANGVPVEYFPFEGEGHGFRRSETVITVLDETLRFFTDVCSTES